MNLWSRTFHISNSGSDAADGLTPGTAWQTLNRANAATYLANDSIALERGSVFFGTLRANRNSLTFLAYGSGALPIISGAVQLTSWISTGLSKWRCAVSSDSTLNLLTISGVPKMMAQDSAWRPYTGISTSSISYTHSGSYLNKRIVMKPDEWSQQVVYCTSDNGSVITYRKGFALVNGSNVPLATPKSNYKFFLSNDTSYLNVDGEWVFDYASQYVWVYSAASPTNVYIANVDTLLDVGSRSNITVKNIRFRYAALYGIYGSFTTNLMVDSCQFEYMSAQGFGGYRTTGLTVQNSTFDQCLQTSIYVQDVTSPYINTTILNNIVTNIGLLFGQGSFWQNPDYSGMGVGAFTGLICNGNRVDNVGDAGIKFHGQNSQLAYNNISNFCMLTADRGGIYNFINIDGYSETDWKDVFNNFISNGYGNLQGTPQENSTNPVIRCIGVYPDGRNKKWRIFNNTIWNVPGGATSNNIDSSVYIYNNLIVMSDSGTRFRRAIGTRVQQLRNYDIRDFRFTNNIVYGSLSTQLQFQYTAASQSAASIIGNFKAIGTIDSNYYNMPAIANYQTEAGTPYRITPYNHAQFVTAFNFGVNDIALPNYPLSQCLFLKNWSANTSATFLNGKSYINAQGTIFSDSARLTAYSGQLLFPTVLTPIVITIDSNPVITLPINSTTISGIATGGTITSYLWRKKTGGAATITSPSNRVTGITGLVAGTYTFTLVATNSLGQTDSSFATVTVNPAPPPANVPPVVTITPNTLQITLPTNTVTLNGSATDSDGTIVGYQWVLVSGTGGTITTPTNDTTTITGLTAGTYIYSLTATDDVGATGSATVQVQVNPQAVISSYPKLRIKL